MHLGAIVSPTIKLHTLVHITVILGSDSSKTERFLAGLSPCERGLWAEQGRFCGISDYSSEKAPNDPQISAIASHDIRLSGKYTCALMTSCSFGLEIKWRKTTAPARGVFPFYELHFQTLNAHFTIKEVEFWKIILERKDASYPDCIKKVLLVWRNSQGRAR